MFPEPADRLWGYDVSPLAPTLRESLDAALTASEQERLLAHLGPEVSDGTPVHRTAVVFLAAGKAA